MRTLFSIEVYAHGLDALGHYGVHDLDYYFEDFVIHTVHEAQPVCLEVENISQQAGHTSYADAAFGPFDFGTCHDELLEANAGVYKAYLVVQFGAVLIVIAVFLEQRYHGPHHRDVFG